jgi:hypothetical protein
MMCISFGHGHQIVKYRNIIASSSLGKRILIFFEKIRFASQKLIYSIFVFVSSKNFNFLHFLFLEFILDEPAMVLRYEHEKS